MHNNRQTTKVGRAGWVQGQVLVNVRSGVRSAVNDTVLTRKVTDLLGGRGGGGLRTIEWVEVTKGTGTVTVGRNGLLVDVVQERTAVVWQPSEVDVHQDTAIGGGEGHRTSNTVVEGSLVSKVGGRVGLDWGSGTSDNSSGCNSRQDSRNRNHCSKARWISFD